MKIVATLVSILTFASVSHAGPAGLPEKFPWTAVRAEVRPLSGTADFPRVNMAIVAVDATKNSLSIELFNEICPPNPSGISCKAMPILIGTYEVTIDSIETGMCGSIVYSGSFNQLPVDGLLTTLVIQDNRDFYKHCMSVREVAPTTGSLRIESGRPHSVREMNFEGELLL